MDTKKKRLKILYAGDSEVGGPANYLLGIIQSLSADWVHIPPSKKLSHSLFKTRFDVIVLSDFSKKHTPVSSEQAILRQVGRGSGFLMVGGWGSFSGPFGGWRGTKLESILPVNCLERDDRLNIPGGAHVVLKKRHSIFGSLDFKNPPAICGLNQVRPKKKSSVLLTAKRLVDRKEFPLLVIDPDPHKRVAALTTDLAPHWAGGLVDWGRRRLQLQVRRNIQVEVGNLYFKFVVNLIRWLAPR